MGINLIIKLLVFIIAIIYTHSYMGSLIYRHREKHVYQFSMSLIFWVIFYLLEKLWV